ncbi:MAG: excinuclease ABC subunit UvrC [Vigna little leaf phytoplasma]|nr:excinuclease ABC subunit UvrC [Vigna little leaf phytoplasma]
MLQKLNLKIHNLPMMPGCYLFKNKDNKIIYVGKAKNIKNRVQSYFCNKIHNNKTYVLISEINDIDYILTNNELEALILESNLIKQNQPKYNFKLTDDKTYPYIEITEEKHPRLKLSHYKQIKLNKKFLFGPYPNNESTKKTLQLLQKIFPLRRCNPIAKKPCLYYQMKQCLGPCCQKEVNYQPNINAIVNFLEGNDKKLLKKVYKSMMQASKNLEFEKAAEYKELFVHLQKVITKQIIDINTQHIIDINTNRSFDIISFFYNENHISLYILRMNKGRIFDYFQIVFDYVGEVIDAIITSLYSYYKNNILPQEMILGSELAIVKDQLKHLFGSVKICIPKKSIKFNLYQLSLKNAKEQLVKFYLTSNKSKEQYIKSALDILTQLFGKKINHIEVFDNSHLFGESFVSAMIVFKEGKLDKASYRTFHITKHFANEYQAFENVLKRYYNPRFRKDKLSSLPDLILVDGGLGQLRICDKTLKKIGVNIPLGCLQKNEKHHLTNFRFLNNNIVLKKDEPLFRFLNYLSAEVHRFTINFHRLTKKKKDQKTILKQISGLGLIKYKKLLNNFTSLKEIIESSFEDLEKLNISRDILIQIKEKYKESLDQIKAQKTKKGIIEKSNYE